MSGLKTGEDCVPGSVGGGPGGLSGLEAEELRRARLLLERAEEMAGIGSWEFDYATRIVNGSPGALRIYGAPSAGLSVADMEAVPLPEYRALLDRARDELIARGEPYDVEFKIRRLDDGEILDLHSRAVWDGAGKRLFGIIRDITKEKRAEAEIRALNLELEERVRLRTAELAKANEALQRALAELEASHQRAMQAEKMAALGRLVAALAHELNTPLGAIRSESDSGLRASSSLGSRLGILAALPAGRRDLVLALVAAARPETALDGLEGSREARKGLEELLGGLGLDSAEAGAAADELVEMGMRGGEGILDALAPAEALGETIHLAWELSAEGRAAAVIREAAAKAERVVRALRTYGAGGLGQKIERVELRSTVEGALALLPRAYLRKTRLEISCEVGLQVLCFREELEQVWLNLATNAVQAMGEGGWLRIEAENRGDEVLVHVTDDGPGIEESIRDKIFTPFFSTKGPGEGSGLGLDISRRVLEEIGGELRFESRPGRTRFTARLRLAPPEPVRSRETGADCPPGP